MRSYEKIKGEIITLNHYLLSHLDKPNPKAIEKIRMRISLLITEALEVKKLEKI